MERVYNFAAGPAAMPEAALRRAAEEMLCYQGSGMSVMEMSHRSAAYQEIFDHTVALLRELMDIPEDYAVLLLQGGATGQFAAAAMNLLRGSADYLDCGHFAHSAMVEAQKYGVVRCAASTREASYRRVPRQEEISADPAADYLYYTTNNTIYGTAFDYIPETEAPLVADMSSNILSGPCDVRRFGVIFAGAQKNIGPAGLTAVIVRRDLLGRAQACTPSVLNWTVMADKGSMLNTLIRNADRVKIACLAQLVNVIAPIMTRRGGGAWVQTIYWPLMHASVYGRGTALRPVAESPVYDCADYDRVPLLDASATLAEDGGVTIFAVNRSLEEDLELSADLRDFGPLRVAEHLVLHHDDVKAVNTEAAPDTVSPFLGDPGLLDGGRLTIALPALSWNVIRLERMN